MPLKISKAVVDANIREKIFEILNVSNIEGFSPINARQWGCLVEDINGEQRYVRVGVIVAEQREDMTAADDKYNAAQEKKAAKAAERKAKAERDKAKREKEKEKEGD